MVMVLYKHRIHGKLGLQLSFRWVFKEKSKQMYPVMGEKQMSKRLGGIKGCKFFKEKSERYITSRNGWVSLKGIFRWYICRRDPSTYQNTPGPSGHTNA